MTSEIEQEIAETNKALKALKVRVDKLVSTINDAKEADGVEDDALDELAEAFDQWEQVGSLLEEAQDVVD